MVEMLGGCAGPACGRFVRMLPVMACDLHVAAREPRAVILGCPIGPSHIESGAEVAPHLSAAEQEQDWIREQTCLGNSPPEAFRNRSANIEVEFECL